jgi:pyruvate,water dikinase
MLLEGGDRTSVASIAVAALAAGRADGDLTDEELIAARPVVLALVPPAIGRPHGLPPPLPAQHGDSESGGVSELGPRDALRLRCRWVQELTVRIADQLGARLAAAGVLDRADLVADMTFDELRLAVEKGRRPVGLDARASTPTGPPLPVAFRLTPSGAPVAVRSAHHGHADGLAASAGRAFGVACHGVTDLTTDEPCVLVVDTLDPRLATALPDVAGLVSETGSALSHLAILAREMHVPAVVGVADARSRFPSGTALLVDGSTGEVRSSLEEER